MLPDVVVAGAAEFAGATELAGATEVSDELLPHNSCTAGEIGCVRSPAWNSERKIGSDAPEEVCDVAATGMTLRWSGKLERYAALSIAAGAALLATLMRLGRSPPAEAIAVCVTGELAAAA